MSDDKKPPTAPASAGALADLLGHVHRNADAPRAKSARKKRRRVGQLNDGEWAPGYGPNGKIKKAK